MMNRGGSLIYLFFPDIRIDPGFCFQLNPTFCEIASPRHLAVGRLGLN